MAPKIPGLFTGLKITLVELLKTLFPKRGIRTLIPAPSTGAVTVQYPHENEAPAPRARGVIALKSENCTVCMLCSRSCPDWCIYIEGHKEKRPPRREGGRERSVSVLDRFDIDYALCMYCGICVEVCPFDALFWSPEYEYSEWSISKLLHDKQTLGQWMEGVSEPEPLEVGAETKR
jgi:NADH-quinone oxidoreductase subunit I